MNYSNLTICQLLTKFPAASRLLADYGLEKFADNEVLSTLGSVLKVSSALKISGINPEIFFVALEKELQHEEPSIDFLQNYSHQQNFNMVALLPCGLKMPFKRKFLELFENLPNSENFNCLIEGNVNHELSYYPYIDTLDSADEIPEILISSDINSFFHHKFVNKFINSGVFSKYHFPDRNKDFEKIGYVDPDGRYTMLSANILVIVENKKMSQGIPTPKSWEDLLKPVYKGNITMRGQDDFFCSAVILPILKQYGSSGVAALAENVSKGVHPAEMVEEINVGNHGTAFYIMPLFFSDRIKNKANVNIIFPAEGAIISPVFMLVKDSENCCRKNILDFITGYELNDFCSQAGFPSVRTDVSNNIPEDCRLWWIGWDYLAENDPLKKKEVIKKIFAEHFRAGKLQENAL